MGTRLSRTYLVQGQLSKDFEYPINEILYIKTRINEKTVILRIKDMQNNLRTYFLPDFYANFFRDKHSNSEDIITNNMVLVFKGFNDEINHQSPDLKIFYLGNKQLSN